MNAAAAYSYSADRGQQHSPKFEFGVLSAIEWSGLLLQVRQAAIPRHRKKQSLHPRAQHSPTVNGAAPFYEAREQPPLRLLLLP